ncbi:MAG: SufD family Fe-S cluster assembly protein [Lachnospiraceae bacterium]|nr:SufD family Fe-S cluster assembly protein [Lachnospiraceae bacterium]
MKMNARVNNLPVLTMNSLKLNSAPMDIDIDFKNNGSDFLIDDCELPDGIKLKRDVNVGELLELFAELGISNPKELVVAGKYPMYNRQNFATGMGADVDKLMELTKTGADIYTVENAYHSDNPILLHYNFNDEDNVLTNTFIHAKEGSESTFIMYYTTDDLNADKNYAGFVGNQTRVYLEKNAKVHLIKVQMLDKGFTFFDDIGGFSESDSSFEVTKLELGAGNVYDGLNEAQMGYRSDFKVNYGYIGLPETVCDINYNDVFWGKKSNGVMKFSEALIGNAKKTFRGTVDFRAGCRGASGDEQEDVLLFGDDIVNKTIPLILGEEEEVEGRHAATIGKLSDDMLFYMQTRGIDRKKAEELMVEATITAISARVPSRSIQDRVKDYIRQVFL